MNILDKINCKTFKIKLCYNCLDDINSKDCFIIQYKQILFKNTIKEIKDNYLSLILDSSDRYKLYFEKAVEYFYPQHKTIIDKINLLK